uniref:Uncharacterized protein n=1 Tax=Tanacetum cinerariifolium TaxID=118510 RepID=A0A699I6W4_TANCI|nr:hypothetical protein [Tanacetum cinerariifolium]
MDDPNITMEEYIRLEDERARRQGQTFNWQTARYGKMEYCEDEDDSFTDLEIEYPAIGLNDVSDAAFLREPTISPLENNEIDFNISFDESDDEDYMALFTSHVWRRLFDVRVPLVREFMLKCFGTGLHSEEEMAEAGFGAYWSGRRMVLGFFGGHFIGRLATHFRLVGDQGLRSLSVVVAPGPERQYAAAVGAPRAAEDAPAADEVLLVYKVTTVSTKVNAVGSRVTAADRVTATGWIKTDIA